MKHQITYVLKDGEPKSLDGLNFYLKNGYCVVHMMKIERDTKVLIILDRYN